MARYTVWRLLLPLFIFLSLGGGLFRADSAEAATPGYSISNGTGPNNRPAMGISPSNDRICATWATFGDGPDAYVRLHTIASNSWSPPLSAPAVNLSESPGENTQAVRCTIDTAGNVHVTWQEGGSKRIEYRRLPAGADAGSIANWTAKQTISAEADAQWADITASYSETRVWLAYFAIAGESYNVFVRSWTPAGGWSGAQQLTTNGGFYPRIAVDNAGYVHVTYRAGGTINYTYRDPGTGAFVPAVQLPGSNGAYEQTGLAVNRTAGDVHAVYSGDGGTGRIVYYVKKTGSTGTAFSGPTALTGPGNYVVPRVAWSPTGRVAMVSDLRDGEGSLTSNVSNDNGASFAGASSLAEGTRPQWPWTVADNAGTAYAVYWNNLDNNIYFTTATGLGGAPAPGAPTGTITASPNPTPNSATTVSWTAANTATAQVYLSVNGGAESLFASGASGSAPYSGVAADSTSIFRLYSGTNRERLLDTVGVTRSATSTPTRLQYYPLPRPVRLLDTRAGATGCDTYATGNPLKAGRSYTEYTRVTCEGLAIPASAQAVVGNATAVNTGTGAADGFVTLYPSNAPLPGVSTLNYTPGQIVANAFTIGLGGGSFNVYANTSTDVIVDITGYYAPPGAGGLYYHPLPRPVRLLDTRAGAAACYTPGSRLMARSPLTQPARGACEGITIPADARAIVGNATAVNTGAGAGAGFVTLYPSDAGQPSVSTLNYAPGQIVANAFTVGLSSGGAFNLSANTSTDVIIDIAGYYSTQAVDANGAGLLYNPLASPVRLLDTRAGAAACYTPGNPLMARRPDTQPARGVCGIPVSAQTIVGNATVVNTVPGAGPGFVTLYPSTAGQPSVSNLNYVPGQIVANAFTVGLGVDGAFNIYANTSTNIIVDVNGYFAP